MNRACIDCGALTTVTRCRPCAKGRERARGSREQRGYDWSWRKLSRAVIARDGGICQWCGAPATTTDHLVPKVRGGSDDPSNLVASCVRCNSSRGGRGGTPAT